MKKAVLQSKYWDIRKAVIVLLLSMGIVSCKEVALYERLSNMQGAKWSGSQASTFEFDIEDTTKAYQIFVVLRHTNRYPYRNIWLNIGIQQPGDTAMRHQQFELALAGADQWLGRGMDDIFERRAALFSDPVVFKRKGKVKFSLAHTMRLDPLPEVLQAGIRVEPAPVVAHP